MSQSTSFSCISLHSLPWLAPAVAAVALSVVVAFVVALVVVVVAVFGDPYSSIGLLQLTKRVVSQVFGAGGFGFGSGYGGFAWWVLFGFCF